jgi:hypothetical protein
VQTARGLIGDLLRRARIAARLRAAAPSSAEISSYYRTYAGVDARLVRVSPAAPWLGGRRAGFAVASQAPPQVFAVPTGHAATIRTMTGTYKLHAAGEATPLGALPLERVRPAIRAALAQLARNDAFDSWLLAREQGALARAVCWRDQLPAPGVLDVSSFLPFLAEPF